MLSKRMISEKKELNIIPTVVTKKELQSGLKALQYAVNASGAEHGGINFDDFYTSENFSIKNMQGYVGLLSDKKTMVIGIACTNQSSDWMYNLRYCFSKAINPYNPDSKYLMHSGFKDLYMMIREYIHNRINFYIGKYAITKILNTGFSLGASTSIILRRDIQYNFPKLKFETHVFGAAGVWNYEGAVEFNSTCKFVYTWIHGRDLVTRMPPFVFRDTSKKTLTGYYHVGKICQLEEQKYFEFLPKELSDHRLKYYKQAIERAIS